MSPDLIPQIAALGLEPTYSAREAAAVLGGPRWGCLASNPVQKPL